MSSKKLQKKLHKKNNLNYECKGKTFLLDPSDLKFLLIDSLNQ